MNNITKVVGSLVLAVMVLASCETGPEGPDPGQELTVQYPEGGLNLPKQLQKSADLIMSGDSVRMTFVYYPYDTIINADLQFNNVEIGPFDSPAIRIRFKNGVPSAPGTFPWEPVTINVTTGYTISMTQGVVIRYNGFTYYPVEGNVVVTEVRKNSDGTIAGITGYFNGRLRTHWPAGFSPSISNPVPPGYDLNNPSLVGEHLTAHSCVFTNRTNSSARPTGGQ